MSVITLIRADHFTIHQSHPCPFRIRHSPESLTLSSLSWCAHHDFSDNKSCNILQPCSVITAIAQDASFRIQTALLWIRSGRDTRKRATTKSSLSQEVPVSPSIQVNDVDQVPGYAALRVQEDQPDLGLFQFHRDRLAAAAEAFGWRSIDCLSQSEQALSELKAKVEEHMHSRPPLSANTLEVCKVRVLIDRIGRISIDSTVLAVETSSVHSSLLSNPFMPTSFNEPWKLDTAPCKVYLDRHPTRPSTLTTHKTTHRCVYTGARERLNMNGSIPPTSREVLLYNPHGEIIETSFCTAYFKRNGAWITPAAICGPNLGVSRRLAIENGLCKQGTIELGELKVYEEIWLSNAVRGFFKGVLTTDAKRLREGAGSEEVMHAKMNAGVASGLEGGNAVRDV